AWLTRIGHPQTKKLLAFDPELADLLELERKNSQEQAISRKREKGRHRKRRHDEFYRGSRIYPGDWLKFRNARHFRRFYGRHHAVPNVCAGLETSEDRDRILKYDPIKVHLSCGCPLSGEFYYHDTRHVARCRDCQESEWFAQGFEVVGGFPFGDWGASTVER